MITDKPWGYEDLIVHNKSYAAKFLHIQRNHRLSFQYHKEKMETLCVLEGQVVLTTNDNETILHPKDVATIFPNMRHRIRALEYSVLLEVSTPELDDVERLEDDYGRCGDDPSIVP